MYMTAAERAKNAVIRLFQRQKGGYSDGAPPLPIPNREVKPVCADGTAIPSGRVGSRQPIERLSNLDDLFFITLYLLEHAV